MVGSEARTNEAEIESNDDVAWPECVWGLPDGAPMPLGSADSPSVANEVEELNAERGLIKICVWPAEPGPRGGSVLDESLAASSRTWGPFRSLWLAE